MQCGELNRPTPAVGVDADGEPACVGHMVKRNEPFDVHKVNIPVAREYPAIQKQERTEKRVCEKCGKEFNHKFNSGTTGRFCSRECYQTPKEKVVRVEPEKCFCGRDKGHRGRHIGSPAKKPAAAPPMPKRMEPVVRKTPITDEQVREVFPDAEPFVGDSMWRIPLESGGELMLMYRGDVFNLLRHRADMEFMRGMIATIECKGKLMYPFAEPHKNSKGEMVMVQFEKGFLSDMLDMLEEDEKIRALTLAWSKRL